MRVSHPPAKMPRLMPERGWRERLSVVSTGSCGSIGPMPTISRFFGIVIAMYFDE